MALVNQAEVTAATIALMKQSINTPNDELLKSWTQSGSAVSGMTAYDLEAGAKILYPVHTPIRNRIPRVSGKGGIQANWRAVMGGNSTKVSIGVGQGHRGGLQSQTTKDFLAAYRTIGIENAVTFEADLAAEGFEDLKALSVAENLRQLMLGEEAYLLGGNTSLALGTTPTPTATGSDTGGALTVGTWRVICVALTLEGFAAYSDADMITGIRGAVTRVNADTTSDSYGGGSAQQSAAATGGTVGAVTAGKVTATVTAVRGAVAYAWYTGVGAGNERLHSVTTINSVVITAAPAGTNQLASALAVSDNSTNALAFDGMLTFAATAANNGYYKAMATGVAGTGTPLTATGAGGIAEIDTALKYFWDNFRISPTDIWVSSQEQANISAKILAGQSNGTQRFQFNTEQGMIAGGNMVRSYLNPFSLGGAKEIPIRLHPNLPSGTILLYTDQIDYPLSGISNILQVRTRREYNSITWPTTSRSYQYGIYADEVLQVYAPFAQGIITNIAPG